MSYTEQDTERARQFEQGGALAALPNPAGTRGKNMIALALIAVGALWLLFGARLPTLDLVPGFILLTIGSCFMFFAFWRRLFGLLIPGTILAGLSLGVTFADVTDGASVLFGLGLGFAALVPLGQLLFGVRSTWAVIPAVILFAVGGIVAVSSLPMIGVGALLWLPLALIGLGLALGARR